MIVKKRQLRFHTYQALWLQQKNASQALLKNKLEIKRRLITKYIGVIDWFFKVIHDNWF